MTPPAATAATAVSVLATPLSLTRAQLRSVQRRLGVRVDGVLGSGTRAALKRYQRAHRLTVTGRPDVETLRALGLKVADRYEARLIEATAAADPSAVLPAAVVGVATAIDAARTRIGDPYRSGGMSPGGFDCSGLMVWAFAKAGIALPRTSFEQYGVGVAVPKAQVQPGDLVFFDSAGAGASHVGVATSATTVISATSSGVQEHTFASGYWAGHYVGARRIVA
ncbi:MAG: NlpC/P60 family protein [Patulibacter sp.]